MEKVVNSCCWYVYVAEQKNQNDYLRIILITSMTIYYRVSIYPILVVVDALIKNSRQEYAQRHHLWTDALSNRARHGRRPFSSVNKEYLEDEEPHSLQHFASLNKVISTYKSGGLSSYFNVKNGSIAVLACCVRFYKPDLASLADPFFSIFFRIQTYLRDLNFICSGRWGPGSLS